MYSANVRYHKRSNIKDTDNLPRPRWFSVCCWCCYYISGVPSKACFIMMSYTQCSSNFNHATFVSTRSTQEYLEGYTSGLFLVHCRCDAKPKLSLLVSVFFVWGRVIVVLVNERVSINTPKASFSVSTSNQPSAEQLRERERKQ